MVHRGRVITIVAEVAPNYMAPVLSSSDPKLNFITCTSKNYFRLKDENVAYFQSFIIQSISLDTVHLFLFLK